MWTRDNVVMQQFFQPYCRPKRGNAYCTYENYHVIQIPSSKYGPREVRIDLDDLVAISHYTWQLSKGRSLAGHDLFYASATEWVDGKNQLILMHRLIMQAPEHLQVDHLDHDGLNNRKDNLRLVPGAVNLQNLLIRSDGSSIWKGVSYVKTRSHLESPWVAKIRLGDSQQHLGYFATEEDAARAYNAAAREAGFLWLNPVAEVDSDGLWAFDTLDPITGTLVHQRFQGKEDADRAFLKALKRYRKAVGTCDLNAIVLAQLRQCQSAAA